MRRREFILGLAMLANVGRASAQGRARRIGALITEPSAGDVLETSLREKGWIVGQNLQIEYRITGGDTNLSQKYARELIALQPEVLFAMTHTSMAALHAQHSSIPTVFSMVSDPLGMHYVESFARPGGNVTGFTPRLTHRGAIAPILIVLFARSRMNQIVGSFFCQTRSLLSGAFSLVRWLRSAGCRRSTRFGSSVTLVASCHTGLNVEKNIAGEASYVSRILRGAQS